MATKAQVDNFIATISPIIQRMAKERGYKICSTIIAQAGIESAWNTSSLGYKYHNYFGMKCGSSWKGKSVNLKTKEEYKVGVLTTINDNFRVYDSMEEGVKGYFDFVSSKRYANLKTATTPKQYAEYLKQDGYATSSSYVNTLCNTVAKYGLDRFDSAPMPSSTKSIDELAREVINNLWGNGETRKLKLTQAGYDYKAVQKRVNEILKGV